MGSSNEDSFNTLLQNVQKIGFYNSSLDNKIQNYKYKLAEFDVHPLIPWTWMTKSHLKMIQLLQAVRLMMTVPQTKLALLMKTVIQIKKMYTTNSN
ncbi:hypothetical protein ACFOYZ_19355 [Neobacillus cucumis]|uniref:hypothetical protein n=1 Tax=Neobacillus cucumis TaxID=1740721 RepID=UPI0035F496BC